MTVIQSGHELYQLTKSLLGEQHNNGWACPWCKQLGVYEDEDESTSDRLFVSNRIVEGRNPIRFVCRQATEGTVNHHSVHSVEELFAEFAPSPITLAAGVTWLSVYEQFLSIVGVASSPSDIDPGKTYWSMLEALTYHTSYNTYSEWEKVGFSKETVDRLHLGVQSNGRLTIPIPHLVPDPAFGMYPDGHLVQRTRRAEGVEWGRKYLWPTGLPPSLWYIEQQNKDEELPCRIFEGDTSTIAAVEIWGDGPIAMAPGSGNWSVKMAEYLLARGHTTFHIYADNDKKGRSYETAIIQSFREAAATRGTDWGTLTIQAVLWPEDAPDKYDPREVLKEYGAERAKVLLEQWIAPNGWYSHRQPLDVGRVHAEWDGEYAASFFKEDLAQQKDKLYDLQLLRGTDSVPGLMYHEIGDYVDSYNLDEDGRGTLFLIRSTPGVGKTRAAVRYAEDYARFYLAKRKRAVERKLDALYKQEQTEEIRVKIKALEEGHYKQLSVVFIGPYIDGFEDILAHASDPKLWYNCEARNPSNCQEYDLTQKVINAGYGIMQTCCIDGGICPVREACHGFIEGKQQYMAQLDELVEHPIVYLRHNHLYMKSLLAKTRLVIVDEDPSAVALTPVTLTLREVQRFDSYMMLEGEEAAILSYFLDALTDLIETFNYTNKWLAGSGIIRSMRVRHGSRTLYDLAEYIVKYGLLDKVAKWHPTNFETAADGRIVKLLDLLVRDTLREEEDWNGQVFIQANSVTFYPIQPYPIDPKKPVVALDATGMAYKYQLCFNRPVMEFRAEVYPKNARTHVVTNTENTMNTLHDGIVKRARGVSLYGVRDALTIAARDRLQNADQLYTIDSVPNVALQEVIYNTLGLVIEHGSLLLVTYKTARMYIEEFIRSHFPDYYPYIAFGHFRALRGLNVFENIPAVLVAGTFRIPVDVLKRDLIAFHKDDPELLDLKTQRKDEYYHGTPWRYATLSLSDSRESVQEYIYELEAGEMQQVVGRIRAAVSDEEKHIYLMTARPSLQWMTYRGLGTDDWPDDQGYSPENDPYFRTAQSASWWWWQAVQSMKPIQAFINKYGRMPTARQLVEDTGKTDYMARRMLEHWETWHSQTKTPD